MSRVTGPTVGSISHLRMSYADSPEAAGPRGNDGSDDSRAARLASQLDQRLSSTLADIRATIQASSPAQSSNAYTRRETSPNPDGAGRLVDVLA